MVWVQIELKKLYVIKWELLAYLLLSSERNLFVAMWGDDSIGNGTESNPYASIQQAVWSIAGGYTIAVMTGVYEGNVDTAGKVSSPLSFHYSRNLAILK